MLAAIMALSLLCHTCKLKKRHHFIVDECGCVNNFVGDIVNLAQILEYIIQMIARYPPIPLSHYHRWHLLKVKAGALRLFAMNMRYVFSL